VIFLTVGSRYGFDRLIQGVDDMVGNGEISEPVIAQIGMGAFEPRHMEFERFMPGPRYDNHVRNAHMLIGHAGSGTISLAMANEKPLLVMPRRKRFHEHVNDHQVATARTFERLQQLLAADNEDQLSSKFAVLHTFVPQRRIAHTDELAGRVGDFLRSIAR
jgi:UDP-N-acetylglucosamine transferase subunit ALG13